MALLDEPLRPESFIQRAIRLAWVSRDWTGLKAFGEIDAIPEP
jgi:hypothetical protein